MMLGRRLPKARRFSYTPLYYDPEKEKKERQGVRRIKFQRRLTRKTARARSLVWLLILLFLVVYLIVVFSRLGTG